ncbi:MAG TPA: hypothetical protein VEH01_00930 [Nitrososphaerales archaeon]|nr:hypothetical protein [Nitrososphaerales archaeon]
MKGAYIFVPVLLVTVGLVGVCGAFLPCLNDGLGGPQSASTIVWGSSSWYVLRPSSEGGNTAQEIAYVLAHRTNISGVFFDDFEYAIPVKGTGVTQDDSLNLPAYHELLKDGIPVCAVICGGYREDANLGAAPCLLVFFQTSYDAAQMKSYISTLSAAHIMVGVYSKLPRSLALQGQPQPSPEYLQGAESLGYPVVVWK